MYWTYWPDVFSYEEEHMKDKDKYKNTLLSIEIVFKKEF